jgi:integrase
MALKHKEIEALVAAVRDGKKNAGQVADGTANLYFDARATSVCAWLCRVSVAAKRVNITIGQWPDVTGAQARAVAPVIVRLIRGGFSVQSVRNALKTTIDADKLASRVKSAKVSSERPTPTFEEFALEWYEKHLKDGLAEGPYKRQVIQQLRDHVFPALGRRPINEIKRREITDAVAPLWKSKFPTAKKLRGNIERIFDHAIDLELREDNPTPAPRSLPVKRHVVEHFAALPHERASEFWQWLQNRPRMTPQVQVGLALALLLGKRTGEIRKIKWEQLDLEQGIWTTPALSMKMRKGHRQPLPTQLVKLLKGLREATGDTEFVLMNSKGKPISENAMLYAIKRFAEITTHGFRATLGSWCAERGVNKQVSDFIKAHQPKYLDAAYERTDLLAERRVVLQQWADYVTGADQPLSS